MKFLRMKLPWRLKKKLVSLVGADRLFNKAIYTPDIGIQSLLASPQRYTNIPSTHSIAAYFLERKNTVFVLKISEIRKLSCELKQSKPNWLTVLLDMADRICTDGLQVYDNVVSPVGPSFVWSDLKRGPHRDILYLVRPHRFAFVAILSQAILFEDRFFEPLLSILRSWIKYTKKPKYSWPYYSNLVVTYRIISLTWSWHFLGALQAVNERQKEALICDILAIIKADIAFLSSRLGSSHANNHLLADYFIGWFINQIYPEFVENADFSKFENLWLKELRTQFYSDGGNFEHSAHYHELCCQMAVIYLLIKQANNLVLRPEIEILICRILSFQVTLSGPENIMWPVGDTTQDSLFVLDAGGGFATGALREIYRKVFQSDITPTKADDISLANAFWMLKGQFAGYGKSDKLEPVLCQFQESGFVRISDTNNHQTILFRTGVAPGSNYSPGHMHSDMLSIFLRHRAQDIIVPPGTYSYVYDKTAIQNFRDYLCSRTSQNGLIIEDIDPLGKLTGSFRDKDNGARVKSTCIGDMDIAFLCEGIIESQNVYNGSLRGVFCIPGRYMLVYDYIPEDIHGLNKGFGWQFSPSVSVKTMPIGGVRADHKKGFIRLMPSENIGDREVYVGHIAPARGWVSEQYGDITRAPYIFYPFNNMSGPSCFLFITDNNEARPLIRTELVENQTLMIKIIGDDFKEFILINNDVDIFPGSENLPFFEGKILHIQEDDNAIKTIKALSINKLAWPQENVAFESTKGRVNVTFARFDNAMIPSYGTKSVN